VEGTGEVVMVVEEMVEEVEEMVEVEGVMAAAGVVGAGETATVEVDS
jgi:hypothetical protein